MIEIQGVLVSARDASWLIDHLRAVGRADDVTAAWAIEQALLDDDRLVRQLDAGESDALLVRLLEPLELPAGLVGLCGKLAHDHRNRLM